VVPIYFAAMAAVVRWLRRRGDGPPGPVTTSLAIRS
jgi:hypothetical protein